MIAQQHAVRQLTVKAFQIWHERACLHAKQQQVVACYNTQLLSSCLAAWWEEAVANKRVYEFQVTSCGCCMPYHVTSSFVLTIKQLGCGTHNQVVMGTLKSLHSSEQPC